MKITVTTKGTACELFKSDRKKIDDVIAICKALHRHSDNKVLREHADNSETHLICLLHRIEHPDDVLEPATVPTPAATKAS